MENKKDPTSPEHQADQNKQPMGRRKFLGVMAAAIGGAALTAAGCGPGGVGRETPEGGMNGPRSGMIIEGCKGGPEGCKGRPRP